jgi:hypothetical protein
MDFRRLLFLLVLLAIVILFKPLGVWDYFQRIWARRELIVGTLFTIIVLYLAYGVYTMYHQHMLDWLLY